MSRPCSLHCLLYFPHTSAYCKSHQPLSHLSLNFKCLTWEASDSQLRRTSLLLRLSTYFILLTTNQTCDLIVLSCAYTTLANRPPCLDIVNTASHNHLHSEQTPRPHAICLSPPKISSASLSPGNASRPSQRYISHLTLTLSFPKKPTAKTPPPTDRLYQIRRCRRPGLCRLCTRAHARHQE